jgi:tRNA-splicing ligase RtcB (3'-phosphate/5'-hydroxy nucleic acid ligase)
MTETWSGPLEKIGEFKYRIPKSYRPFMRVDGIIYADDALIGQISKDKAPEQVANVASLPGIVGASLAMPDIHWGYGFCIGGVAATDPASGGVISPGGVGYDINCGVRLLRTNLTRKDVEPVLPALVDGLFGDVPCGVGEGGKIKFSSKEIRQIMQQGPRWLVNHGYGWDEDVNLCEARGMLEGADPDAVSERAYQRGHDQCGTLGSGNHFLEVQYVEQIFDERIAEVYGLHQDQVTVLIHSGSRGLGYQVCEDSLREMREVPAHYGIELPDRQLVCAPVHSKEGQRYFAAMRAAANFAWGNRHMLSHLARQTFAHRFGRSPEKLGMHLLYDVAHNIAKMETHTVDGRQMAVCVHRKGATRAFPPGHAEVPDKYRSVGQPVLIPGDMARASYVLAGLPGSMLESFGSTCHGAGRQMSRSAAIKAAAGRNLKKELAAAGIYAQARGRTGLAEEQPDAYKDINEVVHVVEKAGLSKRVARLRPLGVIKG